MGPSDLLRGGHLRTLEGEVQIGAGEVEVGGPLEEGPGIGREPPSRVGGWLPRMVPVWGQEAKGPALKG